MIVLFALLTSACAGGAGATAPAPATATGPELVEVPLTLYRLIDADGSELGTTRTTADIEAIGALVNGIWSQAGIRFEPLRVRDLIVSAAALGPIVANGDIDTLLDELQASPPDDLGALNGFFLSEAFGVNGFAPTGSRVFFVVDRPTVPDQRVTSHEIGHLLELHHTSQDRGRLMFSGTDGEELTADEQTVARYVARGILDGNR